MTTHITNSRITLPPLRMPLLRTIKNRLDASSVGISLLNITYHTVKFGQLIQMSWVPYLSEASTILNTAKTVIAPFKGLKSIDWWINGGKTSWKWTALNCISVVAALFNTLKCINKFNLMDLSLIQKSCAAVPYFGILPYAGLSSLTSIFLLGSIGLIQLDKKVKYHSDLKKVDEKIKLHHLFFAGKYKELLTDISKKLNTYRHNEPKKTEWAKITADLTKIAAKNAIDGDTIAMSKLLRSKYSRWKAKKKAITYKLIANNIAIAQKALFIFSLSFSLLTPFTGLFTLSTTLEKGCTATAILGLGLPKFYLKYKASAAA